MADFSAFHFIRPAWLLALAGVALIPLVAHLRDRSRRLALGGAIEPHLLEHLLIRPAGRRWLRPVYVVTASAALAVVAIAGPTWQRETPPFSEDKAPLVIVVDTSWSMNAIDVEPTRLERAKDKVRSLLRARAGARTALIAYAGTAHVVMPFTDDGTAIELFLPGLDPSVMPVNGKRASMALRAADGLLAKEPTPGSILFLTDGVPPAERPAFAEHHARGLAPLLVLGIGTSAGGPVRTGEHTFQTDATGARVVARLDKAGLEALAGEAGAFVATITVDDADVARVQRNVQRHLQAVESADSRRRWSDAGYYLVIPIALLSALWFRRGWTVRWAVAIVAMLAAPGAAAAQDAGRDGFRFIDLWLTHDQQGRYYFERGDFKTAASRFDDPAWKGIACYKAGDLRCAVDQFAKVQTPEANYDLGNALARLGEYKLAVAAYDQALRARPSFADARANRALVVTAMRRPKPKDDQQSEEAPDLPPDKIEYDEEGKKGKKGLVDRAKLQQQLVADAWLRSVQAGPGEFLRMKFAIEARSQRESAGATGGSR